MTALPSAPFLAMAEGFALSNALEAIVKGALESELPIACVAAARRAPFEGFARLAPDENSLRILQRHALELASTSDSLRAVATAWRHVRNGRCAVALVPNDQAPSLAAQLQSLLPMPALPDSALVLIVEDDPESAPGLCPRAILAGLQMPRLEPGSLEELRDSVEDAARLSRAGNCAVCIVAHVSLLRRTDTLEARPNRVFESVDAAVGARRSRRGPRPGESLDLLRMARRLELNTLLSVPSPGEREPIGLLCVGPAFAAAGHLIAETGLTGRVPLLRLGLTHPVDEAALLRLLSRCERVIVLEPRPGAVASDVLAVAEVARRRGERLAELWWRDIPGSAGDPETAPAVLRPDDAVRPSILARRVVHVLHALRPALQVASRLSTVAESLERLSPPARGARLGALGAAESAREALLDADQALRAMPPGDESHLATALSIDGVVPAGDWDRVVLAEIWDRRRFAQEGIGLVRQAAREARTARIAIVPDVGGEEDLDLERLISAAVPADSADRVALRAVDLNDRAALRELLTAAALEDTVTIVVARDGPPARCDPVALERALGETDRLGFTPKQRLVWPADVACEIRPPSTEWLIERGLERGARPVENSWSVETVQTTRRGLRLSARPMWEQVEIIRTKPPAPAWRGGRGERVAPPRPIHAQQGAWRAHLAGTRGESPGLAAVALAEAGHHMGYRVQTLHRPAPIGPGRRAWAQVLFTRRGADDARDSAATRDGGQPPLPVEIPYGEADLLVGVDGVETLRAIGPDPALRVASPERTCAVVNLGPLEDQFDEHSLDACRRLSERLPAVTRTGHLHAADHSVACRARFLTDRVLDLVLLGVAFQGGLVPVNVDALETAGRRLELRGYGRCSDAIAYGRWLASQPRLLNFVDEDDEEWRDASGQRLLRRLLLETRAIGWRGRRRARQFEEIARRALDALPGLDANAEGHAARREFLVALHRCVGWGGMDLAQRYAALVRDLHAADRPEGGHELTRLAIRPLAEALLIRDFFHTAVMATSLEHRRRTRDRLAVRRARGDVMERRYLNRLEAAFLGRRYRLDVRTSDWPARVLTVVGPAVPTRLRGTRSEQEIRAYVVGLVERATRGAPSDPERWTAVIRRLAEVCRSGSGFRGVSPSELRLRVEGLE